MRDETPCHAVRLSADSIAELNRSPLVVLARCGVRHGQSFGRSFIHAQEILDTHGTSRRIDADHAEKLCRAMHTWAEGRRRLGWT